MKLKKIKTLLRDITFFLERLCITKKRDLKYCVYFSLFSFTFKCLQLLELILQPFPKILLTSNFLLSSGQLSTLPPTGQTLTHVHPSGQSLVCCVQVKCFLQYFSRELKSALTLCSPRNSCHFRLAESFTEP